MEYWERGVGETEYFQEGDHMDGKWDIGKEELKKPNDRPSFCKICIYDW